MVSVCLQIFFIDTSHLRKHGFQALKPMLSHPKTLGFTA